MSIDLANTGLMRLDRGAMQNWSDLREFGASASPAIRDVVDHLMQPGERVLVVGPIAMDLATEIADVAERFTMVNRSIPDSARYAEAFTNVTNVDIICGDLMSLDEPPGTFDVVLCLEDISRVPSLEDATVRWQDVFEAIVSHVGANGRFAIAVENELGLHRITALRSRYTSNENSAWDVISTYDATRPRTREALVEAAEAYGQATVGDLLPTWDDHTLVAWHMGEASHDFRVVGNALTLLSPALRELGADPSRVTRAAVLADRLLELPSGWLLVGGAEIAAVPTVQASAMDGSVHTYAETGGVIREGADRVVTVPADARLFGEDVLDACASGDAAPFRGLIQAWWGWAQQQATDGGLAANDSDLRFDNLLQGADSFVNVAAAAESSELIDAAWRAIVDFVAVLRARGARHLWPAAMDDRTMAATIGAMAEMPAHPNLDALIDARATQLDLPAYDVSGLLAIIERLEETNEALASRASWFEGRLNQRERELRQRSARQAAELARAGRQQEALRKSAEDLRKSVTYRLGNVAMGPLKEAKKRFGG